MIATRTPRRKWSGPAATVLAAAAMLAGCESEPVSYDQSAVVVDAEGLEGMGLYCRDRMADLGRTPEQADAHCDCVTTAIAEQQLTNGDVMDEAVMTPITQGCDG